MLGKLATEVATDRPDLLAPAVVTVLAAWPTDAPVPVTDILVAPIDPELADTAAFCEAYGSALDASANCVVVAGRRDGEPVRRVHRARDHPRGRERGRPPPPGRAQGEFARWPMPSR